MAKSLSNSEGFVKKNASQTDRKEDVSNDISHGGVTENKSN